MKTNHKKSSLFLSVICFMLTAITPLPFFPPDPARAADFGTQTGLNGTLWKIISWATNDEHAAFYNGKVYYVVQGDYYSVDMLEDSFYREYDRYSIASAAVPERFINYPGDIVLWGILNSRIGLGFGFSLPLPARALLVLVEREWNPDN